MARRFQSKTTNGVYNVFRPWRGINHGFISEPFHRGRSTELVDAASNRCSTTSSRIRRPSLSLPAAPKRARPRAVWPGTPRRRPSDGQVCGDTTWKMVGSISIPKLKPPQNEPEAKCARPRRPAGRLSGDRGSAHVCGRPEWSANGSQETPGRHPVTADISESATGRRESRVSTRSQLQAGHFAAGAASPACHPAFPLSRTVSLTTRETLCQVGAARPGGMFLAGRTLF